MKVRIVHIGLTIMSMGFRCHPIIGRISEVCFSDPLLLIEAEFKIRASRRQGGGQNIGDAVGHNSRAFE